MGTEMPAKLDKDSRESDISGEEGRDGGILRSWYESASGTQDLSPLHFCAGDALSPKGTQGLAPVMF